MGKKLRNMFMNANIVFLVRVCVGIRVPPDDNEDWYCRNCLAKKEEALLSDKKKKRKKKEKKDHWVQKIAEKLVH